MLIPLLSMCAGLLLLTGGAESLVRGAASFAHRLGLPSLVIGLTVVAFGTSMPELVVSVEAAFRGSPSVALGNIVGSNIANIGLILGIASLIVPLEVHAQVIRFDMPILAGVSLLLVGLLADGAISRLDGALLVAALVVYTTYSIRWAQTESSEAVQHEFDEALPSSSSAVIDVLLIAGGFALLVVGARLLVGGAVALAVLLDVSEVVIGLTIVAIGTSLPELATSAVAAWRGEGDLAIGNVVGSCVFNILGILGFTALVHPLSATSLGVADGAVMVGFTLFLLPLMRTGFALSRLEGVLLLAAYLGYLTYLVA